MAIKVRPTVAADLEEVSRVLTASYSTLLVADYLPETLAVIVPLISRAKVELVSSGTYFAAEENGYMIAVGGWTRTRPGTNELIERLGHIRHVASDPAHLRKGAAGLIMQHCLSNARTEGLAAMECLSTRTAVPFYAKCGFEMIAEKEVLVAGVPFASVEMKLVFKVLNAGSAACR
jgi:N-acetylglutamate synthase-like GNAT family acetyltransferase